MKRLLAIALGAALIFSLAACGGTVNTADASVSTQNESTDPEPESVSTETESASTEPESTGSEATEPKTLVAYFSATGSTKAVAEIIARETGGDLFEITPQEPYTAEDLDWNTAGSRVNKEHDDESLRDIALAVVTPGDWEEYDTVYIGYPIWWGIAAWPVNGFVSGNDFAGKTVIPFCTSMSSGAGESGELLAALADGGDWQSAQRFASGAQESDVTAWLASLAQ